MKKEKVIQLGVMCIVSLLVLVGFTVAWFSGDLGSALAKGMQLRAEEQGDIRIALKKGGADISTLEGEDKYVDVGLEQLSNIEFIEKDTEGNNVKVYKMAPGTYGEVVFYVTPLKPTVGGCTIQPEVRLKDKDGSLITESSDVYRIANEHLVFYYYKENESTPTLLNMTTVSDEDGTSVTMRESARFSLQWDSAANKGIEKEVILYWRWDYEYPTDRELPSYQESSLNDVEKSNRYNLEDTKIGNEIKQMKFHFEFTSLPGTTQ